MRERELKGVFLVLTAAMFWGFLGVITNFMKEYGLTAYDIAFVRLFSAALILGVYIAVREPSALRLSGRSLWFCLIIGLISQGLFNIFYFTAIMRLGITAGVVMLYTAPAFTLVFSALKFGTALGRRRYLAIMLTFSGSILTVTGGGGLDMSYDTLGILAGLLAGASYGVLPVFNRIISSREKNYTIMLYSFIAGALVVLPFIDLRGVGEVMVSDYRISAMGAALGFFPTIASHFAFLEASKMLEAFKVSILANFEVVVAAGAAFFIYSEDMGPLRVLGIAVVIGGAVLPNLPGKKYKKILKKEG